MFGHKGIFDICFLLLSPFLHCVDRCIQYEITANVTDYTPVCVLSDTASCTCKKSAPRVNSMCCTNKGQINQTLDMCRGE